MSSSGNDNQKSHLVERVEFSDGKICLFLNDGREVRTPLSFYPRLASASKHQLENYKVIGMGTGISWPDLDEDLSVESIIEGREVTG